MCKWKSCSYKKCKNAQINIKIVKKIRQKVYMHKKVLLVIKTVSRTIFILILQM